MSGLRETIKSGWHPKGKDGKSSESWRGDFKGIDQVAGWIGKGKDSKHTEAAREHISRPLSTLKDPSSFGPPPKNVNYHGGVALPSQITPPLTQAEIQAKQKEEREREVERERRAVVPSLPFRVDATGLPTANLPPPPMRADSADSRNSPMTSKPKPGLPPRLPPRQNSTPEQNPVSPPPRHGVAVAEPPEHKGILNQGALNRLGAAGVSVPGFGIGGKQPLPSLMRTNPTEAKSETASNGGSNLNDLQSRFSRMPALSSSSEAPTQGTTLAQKQAALRTASAFRNDPSSVSLADARNAVSTANNFRERHGDQVVSGWKSANALNQKYGLADKVGKYTNYGSNGPVAPEPAASPNIEVKDNVVQAATKKPPPPPPKKKPQLAGVSTTRAGSPPPINLASKPKPNVSSI